jgi:hypothetical protein
MALRRSERQTINLHAKYYAEYQKIATTLKKAGFACVTSISSENRIGLIIKITKLMGDNFAFIIKYEYTFSQTRSQELFCEMLYKKLFDWINDAIGVKDLEPNYLINLKKTAKKYRKIYEKNRYASWICIKSRFNLDDNIMFRINSYLHYFVTK